MNLSRREFVKTTAAASAAAAVGLELFLPEELQAQAKSAQPEKWVKSVCRYCGTGCGVYVGVKGNKVV